MAMTKKVNVRGLARLETFCHAVVAGDFVFVAGTLGTPGDALKLVEGGTGPETTQALSNIEQILAACDAGRDDIVKVDVYLADMSTSPVMNAAYQAFFGDDPPARMTLGGAQLALGASVEIECVAYRPATT